MSSLTTWAKAERKHDSWEMRGFSILPDIGETAAKRFEASMQSHGRRWAWLGRNEIGKGSVVAHHPGQRELTGLNFCTRGLVAHCYLIRS